MNKYYVLGTNSDLIEIEAEGFNWNFANGFVSFNKEGRCVGVFQLSNIVGVYEIEEGDKK